MSSSWRRTYGIAVLSLLLVGADRAVFAQNPTFALEGVVTDVGYLGGSTVYKVKLDSGAVVRSSMANTARMDRDTYSVGQRVVTWFTPDDCVVLEQ